MPHTLSPHHQITTFSPPPAARHYHSTLSIWLSVDPMADKYPGVSPYVYCANNPVRLVDEDGRDIWELDECGNIINHIEDDMVDQFRIVDDKGESIAESDTYYAGTFDVLKEESGITVFEVNSFSTSELISAFEFFADNMDIEWESMVTDSRGMFLGTSQEEHKSHSYLYVESLGETLRIHCHNHPNGYNLPSGIDDNSGDIQMVRSRSGLKSYIYTRDKGYTEYNQDTYYKPLKIRYPSSLQR